jgi:ATP-binding protein involved in chromosome partitioning
MFFWKKKSSPTPKLQPFERPVLTNTPVIIAVASGKGGVGKSTVTTNLALALNEMGYKVGLLDADLYGPSQAFILGQKQVRAKGEQGKIIPPEIFGIKYISISNLLDEDGPVVWRAPMATKLLQQFLTSVNWGPLDVLLIDLPPGTGDIHITLAQQAQLSGAVIVTTPQEAAVHIAKKGLMMFEQVNVPILGLIENMSGFVCSHCQHETDIFPRHESVESLAQTGNTQILGKIPLDPLCAQSSDQGKPLFVQYPQSVPAQKFREIAQSLMTSLQSHQEALRISRPQKVHLSPETGALNLDWVDGHHGHFSPYNLRLLCPCAVCVDEQTGKRLLNPQSVPLDIRITHASPVGQYGLSLKFSDQHSTGIFKFSLLKTVCECENCLSQKQQKHPNQSFEV